MRDALQDVCEAPRAEGPALLKESCAWAGRSQLAPFQKLARTIRQHWDGIVNYFTAGLRNFVYLRTTAYWEHR